MMGLLNRHSVILIFLPFSIFKAGVIYKAFVV